MIKWVVTFVVIFVITLSNSEAKNKVYHVGIVKSDSINAFVFQNIADELSIDFEYHYYDNYGEILYLLEEKYLDFSGNITFTLERQSYFSFSAPVHIDPSYIFTKKNLNNTHLHRVLTAEGSSYEGLIKQQTSDMYFETYQSIDTALKFLENESFDAVIASNQMLEYALNLGFKAERISTFFDIAPVSIVTKKGNNVAIMEMINRVLSYNSLQYKAAAFMNTIERDIRVKLLRKKIENSQVDMNRHIHFKVEDLQDNGEAPINGLSLSIVERACFILGFHCQLVNSADEKWSDIYNDLDNKSIDMIAAMIISDSRKAQFHFSEPYYKPKPVLISRLGYKTNQNHRVSDLLGEKIGVIADDYFEAFIKQRLPSKPIYRFSSQGKMLDALLKGDVDYIFLGDANFNKLMRNQDELLPISQVKSFSADVQGGTAIAFQFNALGKDYAELFSEALYLIDVDSIINNHGSPPNWMSALLAQKKYMQLAKLSFLGVVILLLLFTYFLYIQTSTDLLTQLGNRRALSRTFILGVKSELVFVYMDINNFKQINDHYGHHVGDKVLLATAQNLQCHWPGKAYRIGGDEFVLTSHKIQVDITDLLQRLKRFSFTIKETGEKLDISLSAGISFGRNESVSLEELLRDIDKKMYRDKTFNPE